MRDILKGIPDKRQDKNTTSLKFKKDLIEFFGEDYKDKICLEIGTSKGYSTRLLSFLFKRVITCEINPDLITFAKNINKDRDNIEFLQKDVYGTRWDFEDIDVVFIDCDHEINAVLSDIQNAISLCKPSQELLIVFDDYGIDNPWEGVKDAISRYVDNPQFKIIKEIGEPKGSDCNPRANLLEVEGVICRYIKSDMLKNVVFIPNIDLGNGRNTPYHYSVKSWKHWCDKNDCELLEWTDLLYPVDYMKITWQRYYLFDILDANNINYDQILMVDADTIVHPDCPNFFNETDNSYCGVMNNGDYEWVLRSIEGFGDELFNGNRIGTWNYINGGFQILNKNHKKFFDAMKQFYLDNTEKIIDSISKIKTATDQTILNFMLNENDVGVKVLPDCYNVQDLYRKNLLYVHDQCWWSDELHFLKAGWIYHFNAIPQNPMNRDVSYWMERTYGEL